MIIIKTPQQIAGIKKSCQLAKKTLDYAQTLIKPGISTQYLDHKIDKYIKRHGAISASLHYKGFPKSVCTSINDVICHGIPNKNQILKDGDIINVDITTILNGFYGDTSKTFPVGSIPPQAKKLLDVTRTALDMSIKSLKPGKYLNDCVGKIIEPYVTKFGYSVVRQLGGHGVGLNFHEDPYVFHFDTGSHDAQLKPGMIFTIEPMINASPNWRLNQDKDGWTVRTQDGVLSAQFEHTILITKTGYQILTA